MNRITTLLLLAGSLSPAAIAQNYILRLEGGPDQIDLSSGPVAFSIDVIGDAEAGLGTHMLWGAFAIESSGAAIVEDITWTHADWSIYNTDHGYTGGGVFSTIEFGQFGRSAAQLRPGSELGNPIGTLRFTLSQGEMGTGDFHIGILSPTSIALSTIDAETDLSYYSTPETLVLQGFTVRIVPSPGSLGLLLAPALLVARRRRA